MAAENRVTDAKFALRGRHIALVVLLGAVVFGTLLIYGDLPDLFQSLREFPLRYLAVVLALVLVGYLIRWVRWAYYLRTVEVDLKLSHSFLIFFSGLSMAISPGKVGELADRRARAEHLLPLLEALQRLGFEDVALVTRAAS